MIIEYNIYNKILFWSKKYNFETGGILGGNNDIIKNFIFDYGIDNNINGCYYPNIHKLNFYIEKWQNNNIKFYGIVHSHFVKSLSLSNGDKEYIEKILLNMPEYVKYLYFPISFPLLNTIVSFKAVKNNNTIVIVKNNIKFT